MLQPSLLLSNPKALLLIDRAVAITLLSPNSMAIRLVGSVLTPLVKLARSVLCGS